MHPPEKIRNVAIVAHIDHGKTSLLDCFLRQAQVFRAGQDVEVRVMDSDQQERERGITIFSKHTAVDFRDFRVNIIDTPGHADFSGEVERVLGMVESVLLIVDAGEGPMPQTRFVLSKALQLGMRPIVVLNKIDRPHADPDRALNLTFDLFSELGATDEQLDFTYCYASALSGYAKRELADESDDLTPLLELITEAVPPPDVDAEGPFQMRAATLSYDDFVGRQASGQIRRGRVRKGDPVVMIGKGGVETKGVITRVQGYHGIDRVELEEAGAGDIVSLAGFADVMIGDTLCAVAKVEPLPRIEVEEPTVAVDVTINSSPFAGRDGKFVTMNKLRERLEREKKANITLRIEPSGDDSLSVAGRGELHLAVFIESLRREGFELSLSKPRVLIKEEDGKKLEPIESAHVEVPEEYSGWVIEELSKRKGEMQALETNEHGITIMEWLIPTRGLMGYRNSFLTNTRGLGILTSVFHGFEPWRGELPARANGVLIAMGPGQANAYAIFNLQPRGTLFVAPTNDVYEGMVVGQHNRDNDLVVNIIKGKQLTNVRAAGSDENLLLTPPRSFTLEQAIDYVADDELVEVTPKHIRLRKRVLKESDRKRKSRV